MHTRRLLLAALVLSVLLLPLAGCNELRIFFPKKQYETEPPPMPIGMQPPVILVFTKTNGYRHEEAIPAGLALFKEIAKRRGWSIFQTENGAVFNDAYLRFVAATVWHQTSGDTLNADQKDAFRRWLEAGGGFVGIHGAGGDLHYDWPWYVDKLIGAQFIGHTMGPQFQDAKVVVEDHDHPATAGLPDSFVHNDEWYSFDKSPRTKPGFRILASVDESTYSPRLHFLWIDRNLAMGDHPVAWSHCVGRGRVFYTALGHEASAYQEPEMKKMLEGAIAWAARLEGKGCD